jgi:DNA-directed RNA polymerase subunit RPC12/RpoP
MALLGIMHRLLSLIFGGQKRDEQEERPQYPIYEWDFIHSITWRCTTCEKEFYWLEEDDRLICHRCHTDYDLSREEFPDPLRAKCWNCDRISDAVGGFRQENISFDCPHCEFWWESSPW